MEIPAILAHPEILGPPLERGIRYIHNFAVEVISDGKRLWAVESEEGKQLLHQIAHRIDPSKGPTVAEYVAAGYRAENYPPYGYTAVSTPDEIAVAIAVQNAGDAAKKPDGAVQVANQSGVGTTPVANRSETGVAANVALTDPTHGNGNPNVQALDPEGKPATGGNPEPDGVKAPPPNPTPLQQDNTG